MTDRTITLTERQVRMLREALDCFSGEGGPYQGWIYDVSLEEWEALEALLDVEPEPRKQ